MNWLILVLCTGLSVEVVRRLPLRGTLQRLTQAVSGAWSTLRSTTLSDEDKERALLSFAGSVAGNSLRLTFLLCAGLLPALLLALAAEAMGLRMDILLSWTGLAVCSLIALIQILLVERRHVR